MTLSATCATAWYSGPCSTMATGLPLPPRPPGARGTMRAPGMSCVRARSRATIWAELSGRSPQLFSGSITMPLSTAAWLLKLPVRMITRGALPRLTSSIAISPTCVIWRWV